MVIKEKVNLYLYNTLTRQKDLFKPIDKKGKKVGMYVCGPTVYSYQHIGNLRTYIFSDILRKTLEFNKYKVKQIMNVTDVGHLTSDADTGEDKMEKAAIKEGKKAEDIANFYLKIFQEDLKKLNIDSPSIWCKATEHIKEQIEMIKVLEKKSYTYKTSDGIYFDTSKFKDYGKLARLDIKGLRAGKRITKGLDEKKNKTDFALWKFSNSNNNSESKRQQEWQSPWGIGFPGWHIECSAMSSKYLGKHFDIHTGGIDHIPIHHTNEIAQSECAFNVKPWVNYWMHGAFLTFKGEKVSKSKGGLLTISELEEQGFNPLDYRYFCLTTHYRKRLEFSLENLKATKTAYDRMKNLVSEIKKDKKINKKYLVKFEEAINDDLNMPKALAVLWDFLRDKEADGKYQTIKEIDKVFSLDLLKEEEKISIPKEIQLLVKERERARKNKDWKKADMIREKIKELGYVLDDTNKGVIVKKI